MKTFSCDKDFIEKVSQRVYEKMVEHEIIGADEVAEMLGCSVETVYRKLDEIPHTKFGRSLRFFKGDIYKMLRR